MFFGCASIQQPTGGPKDTEPPKVLSESPKNFTLNFNSPEISIQLNEYFKLSNTAKEISLSPDVDKQPEYKIKKKYLNIKFQDTLEKNTTYTINFGNGIVDYNEGNILKNYSYVFSTGNKIDSLSISGTVTNAITKEPQLDATVFLLPINQDTLFGKKRLIYSPAQTLQETLSYNILKKIPTASMRSMKKMEATKFTIRLMTKSLSSKSL